MKKTLVSWWERMKGFLMRILRATKPALPVVGVILGLAAAVTILLVVGSIISGLLYAHLPVILALFFSTAIWISLFVVFGFAVQVLVEAA